MDIKVEDGALVPPTALAEQIVLSEAARNGTNKFRKVQIEL